MNNKYLKVSMKNSWQSAAEVDVCTYFDVNPKTGLTDTNVLERLKKFGNNTDPFITLSVQRCMHTMVKRNGRASTIKFSHVAPGDIVLLEPGNRVPADIRLLYVHNLVCNQSSINGDTAAIKNTYPNTSSDLNLQKNMAFAGSFVVSGSGYGIVVARGSSTAQVTLQKPQKYHGIKNNLLMRRLKRYGIVVQHSKVLSGYKNINFVIIEVAATDAEIIDVIRKVQLTQGITCKFIVSKFQAQRLSTELNVTTWDILTEKNSTKEHIWRQIDEAQFIVGNIEAAFVKIAMVLKQKEYKFLWITDGKLAHNALQLAAVSMVIGHDSRGDVLAKADLIAPAAKLGIITCILYNNK
jgi:hypothetical protein